MTDLLRLVQDHKSLFDAMQAASSVVSLLGWFLSFIIIFVAWRRGRITRVTAFGVDVTLAQEAIVAASRATRERAQRDSTQRPSDVSADIAKIRDIVRRAFHPDVASRLVGKAVLWVDDDPSKNTNETIALRKMGLIVEQAISTRAGLDALERGPFDLVISDMARGADATAGYDLLKAIRSTGSKVPFLIYSSSGAEEHKREAREMGAQGATNDPRELLDAVVSTLGK